MRLPCLGWIDFMDGSCRECHDLQAGCALHLDRYNTGPPESCARPPPNHDGPEAPPAWSPEPLKSVHLAAAGLFGILIGATALGGLSDVFGRKRMFIAEMVLFTLFLVALTCSQGFLWMVICLFGVGLALGCDYPTAHLVISETVPSHGRGGLILGAFAFQAIGAIAGAGLAIVILDAYPSVDAWRWMYAAAIIPAVLVSNIGALLRE